MSEQPCWRCGQLGHWTRECPGAKPPTAAIELTPTPHKPKAEVECPTCHRDWVAVLPYEGARLTTLQCPWCQKFEARDGEVYHRV